MKTILLLGLLLWPALTWSQPVISGKPDVVGNELSPSEKPVECVSEEGGYRVFFPPGCAKIVSKVPDLDREPWDDDGPLSAMTYLSYCDRHGQKGDGCSIAAFWNLTDDQGGPPGPAQVVERVERMLKDMGVSMVRQRPVRRLLEDGGLIEGVDVLAVDSSGGQAWLRGLLHDERIYLLAAWKADGELETDPSFIRFFQSFEPLEY
ncbi:hypothetical protein CSB20_03920 [bacterium DOLZORAL124_64_63]|nr:MAG: hypothetical protein CSB20_03920 [bacterium DOLZORAL124_64_63]